MINEKRLIYIISSITVIIFFWITILINQQKSNIEIDDQIQDTVIHEIVLDCYTYDMCIEHIKEYEGFRSEPYELDGSWYIGFGRQVHKTQTRITEEEATIQLQETFDWYIRFVVDKYNVHGEKALALALLWYNVSPKAILSSNVNVLILGGSTDNIAIRESWLSLCNFQGKPHVKLRERREFEVGLFFE